jgi:hypothetical protein
MAVATSSLMEAPMESLMERRWKGRWRDEEELEDGQRGRMNWWSRREGVI